MLYYDIMDVSEGIDVNNTSATKECIICHYWYFLDEGFKFQPNLYSGIHNLLMISMNLNELMF